MLAKPAEKKAWTEIKGDAEMKYGIAFHQHIYLFLSGASSLR